MVQRLIASSATRFWNLLWASGIFCIHVALLIWGDRCIMPCLVVLFLLWNKAKWNSLTQPPSGMLWFYSMAMDSWIHTTKLFRKGAVPIEWTPQLPYQHLCKLAAVHRRHSFNNIKWWNKCVDMLPILSVGIMLLSVICLVLNDISCWTFFRTKQYHFYGEMFCNTLPLGGDKHVLH